MRIFLYVGLIRQTTRSNFTDFFLSIPYVVTDIFLNTCVAHIILLLGSVSPHHSSLAFMVGPVPTLQ